MGLSETKAISEITPSQTQPKSIDPKSAFTGQLGAAARRCSMPRHPPGPTEKRTQRLRIKKTV